ncbi:MAG: hypothetical protein GW859_03300 [Sphingomonadales bacterium]|nr:hypothetical protein [Sphingomonadales bacterium]
MKGAGAATVTPPRPSTKRAAKPAAPRKAGATRKAPDAATRAELKQNLAATRDSVSRLANETTSKLKSDASRMSGEAGTRAKEMAREGKDKAAGAIATFAKYIEDSATSVDDRLGDQYGDYARTAAASIAGLATTLEKQDIDELVDGTREFVRKSPAIAIGTAAAIGFVMARMLRGGSSDA